MMLKITKMHGLGNSYVLIEDEGQKLKNRYPEIAKFVSDKGFGVGSDGILVLNKGRLAKYWMRVFNPDGSEAEMCGNGIRMFARYLYDKKLIAKITDIEVGGAKGGRIVVPKINDDGTITVDMGSGESLGKKTVSELGKRFSGTRVSVGNPHFVIFTKSKAEAEEGAREYGASIENSKAFRPEKTNVEFAYVKNKNEIILHVWERGAGLTLACGTGASAVAFIAFKMGLVKNKVKVRLPGGTLRIEVKGTGRIFMSGPVKYVFSSSIEIK